MDKTKQPAVAGIFYSADKIELEKQIDEFKRLTKNDSGYSSRAVIVPHAGYIYSGILAVNGFQYLDKDCENVFIIAPAHRYPINGFASCDYDYWMTPLGKVKVNKDILDELNKDFMVEYNEQAFGQEHSIEVQIPLIQTFLPNAKIVPILVGNSNTERVKQIISKYYDEDKNVFVISSDLSHFYPFKDAKKLDNFTAEMIEALDSENFQPQQACGAISIKAMIEFAKEKSYSMIRIGLMNSAQATGDDTSVVGYGSWFLYEGGKTEYIKKFFSPLVIEICKKSIEKRLLNSDCEYFHIPAVLEEFGASFVTLMKNDGLRGCIGSIIAHKPLIEDLNQNAYNSAFNDSRFHPLTVEELNDLSIAVSLLSEPEKLEFSSEEELLDKIRANIDGIILREGPHQATYLPSVWEQLPDKRDFLNSLKLKAGLKSDYFSKNLEAYRYTAEYIK